MLNEEEEARGREGREGWEEGRRESERGRGREGEEREESRFTIGRALVSICTR